MARHYVASPLPHFPQDLGEFPVRIGGCNGFFHFSIVVILRTFIKRGQKTNVTPVSDLSRNGAATWDFRSPEEIHVIYMRALRSYGEDMGTLRSIEGRGKDRRREPRTDIDLGLTVWGVDTRGDRFLQGARARDISLSGALIIGLDTELRSGDVIGVLYAGKKARFRVVWVRESGTSHKVQAAVHRIAPDECPWKELLAEEFAEAASAISPPVR